MRPLEIALFIALLVLLIALDVRRRRAEATTAFITRILALVMLAVLAVHLSLEGYRWQMVPAYVLVVIVAVVGRRPTGASRRQRQAGMLLLVVGLVVAIALPALLPVPHLPRPDGRFAVGTLITPLVDPVRAETYGPSPSGRRELMLQVWYPAQSSPGQATAPYIANLELAIPSLAERVGAPPFLLASINQAETHAYEGAESTPGDPFPVLIFVHGLGGVRMQNTYQVERLASHGYVVAALDHVYGAAVTIFPDGRTALFNPDVLPDDQPSVIGGRQLIDVWSDDVGLALDYLAGQNADAGSILAGRLNLDAVGVLGHSTGGGTAVNFCTRDPRCQAGIGLDAWVAPLRPEITLNDPFLFLSSDEWLGAENRDRGRQLVDSSATTAVDVTLANTAHFDYSDLPRLTPLLPLIGLTSSRGIEAQTIVNEYSLVFFDQFLKGTSTPPLDGALTPYDGITVRLTTPDS